MSAIRKSLLQLLFSGFTMRRWNDKLRPVELVEIDKQAHKMIVAFLLAHINSRHLSAPNRRKLQQEVVEGGIFDYLYRLVITDIKPPVFYRIRGNRRHYRQLTDWVIERLAPVVRPLDPDEGGFWDRFVAYHRKTDRTDQASLILRAAHLYASQWEFNVIKPFNGFDEEMGRIADDFKSQLDALHGLDGLNDIRNPQSTLGRIASMAGRLRFQIRWSDVPRIPATSVLGHEFLVGVYAYFFSIAVGACTSRRLNNFHAGLFHDLPELLTRDIISPVKNAVNQLPELIKEYEYQEIEQRILAPLREGGYEDIDKRLKYFLGLTGGDVRSEFDETVRGADGIVRRLDGFDDIQRHGNSDAYDPKDGSLLKACDLLAAFMEAHTSLRHGVAGAGLQEAMFRFRNSLNNLELGPVSMGTIFADFD